MLSHRAIRSWLRPFAALGLLTAVVAGAVPAAGQTTDHDFYADDPHRLIASYNHEKIWSTLPGGDSFEVFICYPDAVNATIDEIVEVLNGSNLSEYWESVSNGQYRVTFHPGTTVAPPGGQIFCDSDAYQAASERYRAGLIVGPVRGMSQRAFQGFGVHFSIFPEPDDWVYGKHDRYIRAYEWVEGYKHRWHGYIATFVGATLGFPRSYTGALDENDYNYETDNPMDFMSGGSLEVSDRLTIGVPAVTRYAAGWIDPDDVHVYQGGAERVVLRAGWEQGTQMLAIRSGEQGRFLALGARVAERHDRDIPKEGVEAYEVDQRPTACEKWLEVYANHPCGGTSRRQVPYPHVTTTVRSPNADLHNIPDRASWSDLTDPTRHVSQPGDEFTWNDVTIRIVRRTGDSYEVEITDETALTDWFTDDDGNTHEADINRIAGMGITRGCSTTQALYCPNADVTRAEMAAFLLRAAGEPDPALPATNPYTDVADGVWYTKYVLRLSQMGVDAGADGRWRPNDPLTRLEMAQWLTRMFPHITPAGTPGGLFDDVNSEHWPVVEGLHEAGVTRGCSTQPLSYCPDQAVTRAQMASFIIRALP